MDCQEIQTLIPAYVDGELDLLTALAVEQHLPDCPDCAQAMESLSALGSAMKQPALQYKAPESLRMRIEQSLEPASPERTLKFPSWPALAISSAIAALLAIGFILFHPNQA